MTKETIDLIIEQKPINEQELDKLAQDDSEVYGLLFAEHSHHCRINRQEGFYDGFKAGYRKSTENLDKQRQKDLKFFIDWVSIRFNIPYNGDTVDGEPLAKDYFEWMKERNQLLKELIEQLRKDFYEETE